ncbi:hypothetical protein DZD52_08415 [Xanthomonas nasturtii]|uniref:Uncharacterized protein n=1 Tax=Xanthomonas nasturtii TaxID=1843581 RepID=A0A3E1KM93_9XANT|nr:hypothetical protein DZD52_08415 [Xanthomonas nasturtii]
MSYLARKHTHQDPDGSLPAHRRGTSSGMDAAPELTRTYLQRVLRWWAGKGPAARQQVPNALAPRHSNRIASIDAPRSVEKSSYRWAGDEVTLMLQSIGSACAQSRLVERLDATAH